MQTEERETSEPAFEVEITSGGRAYDDGRESEPEIARAVSPTRAAAKARARRRNLVLVFGGTALLIGLVLWAWLSNPLSLVPSDAVARVGSEFIYERDITREIDVNRSLNELRGQPDAEVPSAASALEEIINRRMRVQDAKKAGVTVNSDEVAAELASALKARDTGEEEFGQVLAKYNLTLDDIRGYVADALLVTRHIDTNVVKGAKDGEERQNRLNEWQTNLSTTTRIDRLKPVGSGPEPRIGAEAPDFTLKDLDGKEITLSSLRGRPVMVNFWATWCPPCRAEIPEIVGMYTETHTGDNYEILGVATQSDDGTVRAFTGEFGMKFPVLPDAGSRVTSLYHVLPIPTTFFIDKNGIIRDMHIGVLTRAKMEQWLLDGRD